VEGRKRGRRVKKEREGVDEGGEVKGVAVGGGTSEQEGGLASFVSGVAVGRSGDGKGANRRRAKKQNCELQVGHYAESPAVSDTVGGGVARAGVVVGGDHEGAFVKTEVGSRRRGSSKGARSSSQKAADELVDVGQGVQAADETVATTRQEESAADADDDHVRDLPGASKGGAFGGDVAPESAKGRRVRARGSVGASADSPTATAVKGGAEQGASGAAAAAGAGALMLSAQAGEPRLSRDQGQHIAAGAVAAAREGLESSKQRCNEGSVVAPGGGKSSGSPGYIGGAAGAWSGSGQRGSGKGRRGSATPAEKQHEEEQQGGAAAVPLVESSAVQTAAVQGTAEGGPAGQGLAAALGGVAEVEEMLSLPPPPVHSRGDHCEVEANGSLPEQQQQQFRPGRKQRLSQGSQGRSPAGRVAAAAVEGTNDKRSMMPQRPTPKMKDGTSSAASELAPPGAAAAAAGEGEAGLKLNSGPEADVLDMPQKVPSGQKPPRGGGRSPGGQKAVTGQSLEGRGEHYRDGEVAAGSLDTSRDAELAAALAAEEAALQRRATRGRGPSL
jgi:hypothetical protein